MKDSKVPPIQLGSNLFLAGINKTLFATADDDLRPVMNGIFVKFSTLLLAILLFIFIITIHIPHLFADADKTITIIALLKDISLMGGSLMISGIYSEEERPEKI